MDYLHWLDKHTPSSWWHDSSRPKEIALALERGARGITTNPTLIYEALRAGPAPWAGAVRAVLRDLPPGKARAEALVRLVIGSAARQLRPTYEASGGKAGLVAAQLDPSQADDAAAMLAQARRYASWFENIVVKLPSTQAGIQVLEHLTEEGTPTCATINTTVAQAVAVARAYERGKEKAAAGGLEPPPCFVVQQLGRLDGYLAEVAADICPELKPQDLELAGLAVAKRTCALFRERGYSAVIMPAGLRSVRHVTALAGGNLIYTISTQVQNLVLQADPEQLPHMDEPVDPAAIDRLLALPEFALAYEPEGLDSQDFSTYGINRRLLDLFYETGWKLLETFDQEDKP